MRKALFALVCLGTGATGVAVQACGGDDTVVAGGSDGSADGSLIDVSTGDVSSDAADAAAPCAPPTDRTKSSLCIHVSPEAIQFLANADFDGKGFMVIDVHDVANPDAPDGAPLPALETATLPSLDAGPDAGEFDLSTPVPTIRFDGLPATVYPRVIFVDARGTTKPQAGWWLGGYDLTNGLGQTALLKPITLTPGSGTTISIDLTALRRLHITLSRSTTPVGNAQGPATVVAVADQMPTSSTKIFGLAFNPCAKLNGTSVAEVNGLVLGKGPYYAFSQLDDYDAGGFLKPGSLTSLVLVDGGLQNPTATQLNYAANAYVVSHTVDLVTTVPAPEAGTDTVVCP